MSEKALKLSQYNSPPHSLPHSIPSEERENAVFIYPQIFINSDDGAESDPFSFIGRLF